MKIQVIDEFRQRILFSSASVLQPMCHLKDIVFVQIHTERMNTEITSTGLCAAKPSRYSSANIFKIVEKDDNMP
jgi:hypothetical protein